MIVRPYDDESWEIVDLDDIDEPGYPAIWCDTSGKWPPQVICVESDDPEFPLPANWHFVYSGKVTK